MEVWEDIEAREAGSRVTSAPDRAGVAPRRPDAGGREVRRPGRRRRDRRRGALLDATIARACARRSSSATTSPSGTSSRSSRLIHGGLRYLEQLPFRARLARRSRSGRGCCGLRRTSSGIEPFLFPLYGRPVLTRAFYGAGTDPVRPARAASGRRPASPPVGRRDAERRARPAAARSARRDRLPRRRRGRRSATRWPSPGPAERAGGDGRDPCDGRGAARGGRAAWSGRAFVTASMGGDLVEVRAGPSVDATGVWAADPSRRCSRRRDADRAEPRLAPRRPPRPNPELTCGLTIRVPGQGRVPRPVAGPLDHRHDGRTRTRARSIARRATAEVDELLEAVNQAHRRRPDAGATSSGRTPACGRSSHRRRVDGQGVARAPGRRRGERARPCLRRQVHDVPGDGPRRGRRGRSGLGSDPKARPSRTATLAAGRGSRPGPALDRVAAAIAAAHGLTPVDRRPGSSAGTGCAGDRGGGRSVPRSAPRAAGPEHRPPRGRGRVGGAGRAWRSPLDDVLARRMRLSQELPDRGASIAPRVAAILGGELGWDDGPSRSRERAKFARIGPS